MSGEVRIVLVGKRGGGRSAAGNAILGRKKFESTLGIKATTLTCQRGYGSWEGGAVAVIDTVDILDPEPCSEALLREIMRCVELSRPGPHALLFVTRVGRFTLEDEAAAKRVLDVFGPEAAGHMVVLFTHGDALGGEPLRDYVTRSGNKAVADLIQKCGGRVCAFNNRAVGAEREGQVSELMGMVRRIVRENGGRHYTSLLYSEPSLTTATISSFMAWNRRAREKAEGACVWLSRREIGICVGLVARGVWGLARRPAFLLAAACAAAGLCFLYLHRSRLFGDSAGLARG